MKTFVFSRFNYFSLVWMWWWWWWIVFCGMVDRQKAFSLISSRDHSQRSSPLRICVTPWAGCELVENRISDFDEWNCAVVITNTPKRHSRKLNRLQESVLGIVYNDKCSTFCQLLEKDKSVTIHTSCFQY